MLTLPLSGEETLYFWVATCIAPLDTTAQVLYSILGRKQDSETKLNSIFIETEWRSIWVCEAQIVCVC